MCWLELGEIETECCWETDTGQVLKEEGLCNKNEESERYGLRQHPCSSGITPSNSMPISN